jgi:hypothetical protein
MATWEVYLECVLSGEITGQRASNIIPFPGAAA